MRNSVGQKSDPCSSTVGAQDLGGQVTRRGRVRAVYLTVVLEGLGLAPAGISRLAEPAGSCPARRLLSRRTDRPSLVTLRESVATPWSTSLVPGRCLGTTSC